MSKDFESQQELYDFKHDLATGLNMLKKFEAGYTSKTDEAIAVEYNGTVYILRIEQTPFELERAVRLL